MAAIDLVCAAILLVAGVRAAVRGFVAEAFSVGAVAVGVAAGFVGHPFATRQLAEWWGAGWWNGVVAALVLFTAGYALVKLVEAVFQRALTALRLKGLDRILGLVMGVGEGLVVIYAMLFLLAIQTVIDPDPWLADSLVQEMLLPWMLDIVPFPVFPPAREAPLV